MKTTTHLDPETLAAFTEGKLKRNEIAPVLTHLDQCAECRETVAAVNDTMPRETRERSNWPWLAVAAAVLIAGAIAFGLLQRGKTPQLAKLLPSDRRTVETRLSGDFDWAPYRGPERASGTAADSQRLKLIGAAGELVEAADAAKENAAAQQTAGVALVLIEEPQQALTRLEAATKLAPAGAHAWSDLAAARYAAALRLGRASLYPEALAATDEALRLQPDLREALFNRAVILERMGLLDFARAAWTRYLEVDPSSEWAKEARDRLAKLPRESAQTQFKSELPKLEAAKDQATVDRVAESYRQQVRTYAEAEWLGRWGEAVQRGDAVEAERMLVLSRRAAAALQHINGETLIGDAVRAIDGSAAPRALADAHVIYRKGRMLYAKRQVAEAGELLRDATARFANAGSPMALVARYYAASARYDRNDNRGATAELEALLREANGTPGYVALGAHARWQLTLCRIADDDWNDALRLVTESAAMLRRLGESGNEGALEELHAETLMSLGRIDDAWSVRVRALEHMSRAGMTDRVAAAIGSTSRLEVRAQRFESARALLGLEIAASRNAGNDVLLAHALVRESILDARLDDRSGASRALVEAKSAVARIADPSLRDRATADLRFAEGVVSLPDDARAAHGALTAAIDLYRAHERSTFLTESYLLRAAAARKLGDTTGAARDLDEGIAALERRPLAEAESIAATSLFDSSALFREAISLALDRGDTAAAFEYAERSRVRIASSAERIDSLRARLRGSGATVLELAVLDDETIVFTLSEERLNAHRVRVPRANVIALAAQAADHGDADASSSLHELLIRPAASEVAAASSLFIVADPLLAAVPFASLRDPANGRFLVEQLPLSLAPSASALRAATPSRPGAPIVAVALPTGDERSVALPESERELDDLGKLYPRAMALAGERATFAAFRDAAARARLIHVAGHTAREPGPGEAALLFAGPPDQQRASWKSVAAIGLESRPVVVLAACETLRTPRLTPTSIAFSLGDGFLAGGAESVIGTLAAIPDEDARRLFRAVHRQLAAGAAPAEAVRFAQLEDLADPSRRGASASWRAIAVLTRALPRA